MRLFCLLVALLVFPCVSGAQVPSVPVAQGGFYRFLDEGKLPIRVNAWGNVRYPGRYELERGTMLSTLVALTGGPSYEPRREGDRRTVRVQLLRGGQIRFDQTARNEAFVLGEDFELLESDVLTVEATVKERRERLQEVAPVVGAAASVLSALVVLIINIAR